MKLPGKIYQCFELWIRERERAREGNSAVGIGFVICGLEMDPGLDFFWGSSSTRFETLATSHVQNQKLCRR